MGTNYYAGLMHRDPDGVIDRVGEIHIGKQSGGWAFGFRGYRADDNEFRVTLDTAQAWETFIRDAGYGTFVTVAYFRDEYGRLYDADALLAIVGNREGRVDHSRADDPHDRAVSDGRAVSFYEFC